MGGVSALKPQRLGRGRGITLALASLCFVGYIAHDALGTITRKPSFTPKSIWWQAEGLLTFAEPLPMAIFIEKRTRQGQDILCDETIAPEDDDDYLACKGSLRLWQAFGTYFHHRQSLSSEMLKSIARALSGRRILIVGDSVDRLHFHHLSMSVPRQKRALQSYTAPFEGNSTQLIKHNDHAFRSYLYNLDDKANENWDPDAGFPARYSIDAPPLDQQLRFDLAFSFGAVASHAVSGHRVWDGVGPLDLSQRLRTATSLWGADSADPFLHSGLPGQQSAAYDLIIINIGLWDLAGYQRRNYLLRGHDNPESLRLDFFRDYRCSIEQHVAYLRATYGRAVPILMRPTHDSKIPSLKWFSNKLANGNATEPFSQLRTHQLRRLQIEIANDLGLTILPFAQLVEGHELSHWLLDDSELPSLPHAAIHLIRKVHPNSSGSAIYWELVLRWLDESVSTP